MQVFEFLKKKLFQSIRCLHNSGFVRCIIVRPLNPSFSPKAFRPLLQMAVSVHVANSDNDRGH